MKLNSSKCCTNTRKQDDDKNRMTTKTATTMITKQGQCDLTITCVSASSIQFMDME